VNKKIKMEIILIQDVDNLGAAHEKVKVKNGYARNFLIPSKLAVEANPANLKQLEERMKQMKKKEEKLLAEVNLVIAKLKDGPLKIGAKAGTSVRRSGASSHGGRFRSRPRYGRKRRLNALRAGLASSAREARAQK